MGKDSEPTIIVNDQSEEQAVRISLEDYQSMEETAYLLSPQANRAHIEKAFKQARSGALITLPAKDL
ncbi:MAG: type II toxin-antitoxin system Phd/YefM family antitoxin [Desulfatitalea sp.]|nr:type II toxin-antitoxin system Phd/YefM family antitoxin [Desulfatitalea sp.]